jgi:uracil-DNA glycosylase
MSRTQQRTAAEFIPPRPTLAKLREIADGCTACDLYKSGTQTVFGEGSKNAELMLVGEQPGDREDRDGRPFVGPAGHLLDDALASAAIDRESVYLTNVVKHFKWEARGKRRIHKKPNASEVRACKPWLEAEIDIVKPKIVLALGATAAQALLGSSFRVTQHRSEFVEWDHEPMITATVHPSSILRAPDEETRRKEMGSFVSDLEFVARALR